jgi:hypothetical protein
VFNANKCISNIVDNDTIEDIDEYLRKSFKKIVKSTPDELRVEQMHISVMIKYLQSRQKKVNSVLEFKTNKYISIKKEMLSICQEVIENDRKRMFSELSQEIDIY